MALDTTLHISVRRSLHAGAGLLALAVSTVAVAQTDQTQPAPTPQAAPAQAAAAAPTQEIVVTAQKRSEKLQNVPISISAVTGAQLAKTGITQVAQLQQSVPALRLNYSGNTIQPSIRGIGSSVAGPGLYSNIPVYVDGYYISSPTSSDIGLIDVDSVSVLKGPQGTLFGRNATGGAIQITTRTPKHETDAEIRLSYESFDHSTSSFYGTTGLGSMIAVSLAASYEHGNGYITNIVNGDDRYGEFRKWSVRPKVLFTPTDNLSFTLTYSHTYASDPMLNSTNVRVDANGKPETSANVIPGLVIATKPNEVSPDGPNFNIIKTDSITLTSALKMDWADLTSYTGYRKDNVNQALDYDASPAAIDDSAWTIPDRQFTQEINLTSKPGGRLSWVLGAFYYWATDTYDYNLSLGGAPYVNAFVSKNTTRSYAGFADVTYEVLDNLFITGGLRYSKDDVKLAYPAGPLAGMSGKASFHNLSPRAVIRYQITPQSNVYASYTKGYKSGALPGSSFAFTPVKPEKIDAYEVGYKIANRRLRFNIAGYYYNYKDVQVATYGAGGTSITQNAASEHIYGVDGDVAYAITPDFNINASAAYTHAEYNKFGNAIGYVQGPTGAFGVVNIPANGFPVLNTPRFSGTVGADYGFDLAKGRLVVNGSVFYSSKLYFDAVKQLPQKKYTTVNLRATWTDPSKKLDLSVYATNVTDKNYRIANFTDPIASRQVWAEPRSVGGSITYHY